MLTVTIDNPPNNFLGAATIGELAGVVASLEHDSSIGALVITSAVEGVFISHADVGEIVAGTGPASVELPRPIAAGVLRTQSALERVPGGRAALRKTPAAGMSGLLEFHSLLAAIQRLDKVVIASINGRCMGGGSELALACDIRIMADGPYVLGQPEICVGIIPGGVGTQRLPRAVGHARALELMLEGRPVTPVEALDIGYVNHLVAPTELVAFTAEVAQRLSRRPAGAVAAIKHAVNGDPALERGLRDERTAFLAVASTKSAREAMRAYLDQLDALERRGVEFTPEALDSWLAGTAFDFT